jgi:uncharacterized protein (DUF305 family)
MVSLDGQPRLTGGGTLTQERHVAFSRSRCIRTLLLASTCVVPSAVGQASTDTARRSYSPADAAFMTGMIAHHAQAVMIAGWAPSHGASPGLQAMTERIVVGQQDEIVLMQRWLRERGAPVPDPESPHTLMPGMDHGMSMPGILTAGQLAQLDQARGPEFDRLFLTSMIYHHQGAITMVNQLFGSQGAAQDETTFRLASDIYADQTTEIDRMQRMLVALPPEATSP